MKTKLPEGWREVEFLDSLENEASNNKLKIQGNDFLETGKYPIIDQGKIFIAGYTNDKSKVYSEKLPAVIFGDHTRIFKFVDFPFALGADGVKILVPKKEIDVKYYFFYLRNLPILSAGYSRHYKFLKEKRIVVPPLPTQQKIVSILEKAEKAKELRKEADGLTGEFLKVVFVEMFGDLNTNNKKFPICPLSEVCELNPRRSELRDRYNKKVSFMAMADVGEEGQIYNVELKDFDEVKTGFTYFKKNDVLFAKITPCMENGKGAIAKIPTEVGFGSTEFHVLRPIDNKTTSEWIYCLLSLRQVREEAMKKMTGSAGQKRVPTDFFDIFKVPIPPLPLQQKFASIVKEVKAMKEQQKHSKEQIDSLFNVLMQKAFKAELVS